MPEIALLGLVMILGLGAYWSMVIFPRQRDFQKREQYFSQLEVGDEIITYGGIIGRIKSIELDKGIVHLEIDDNVVIRLIAASIARKYDPSEFEPEPTDDAGSPTPQA